MAKDAIILAAGYGSRLQEISSSKPLARVCGVTLIELAIRQAAAAGVQRAIVVTGHEASMVEDELSVIAARGDVEVTFRRLEDWSKPNGWSVIAGAQDVTDPFLLMMADHIFGDGLLGRLAAQDLGDNDVILAVDRVDNPLVDPDDATWVARRTDGTINKIGKHIAPYDAVDCGVFLANRQLASAIEHAISQGKAGSLSDGMQVLADRGRAGTLDVSGAWWIDVDDPRAHAMAEAQISDHVAAVTRASADA